MSETLEGLKNFVKSEILRQISKYNESHAKLLFTLTGTQKPTLVNIFKKTQVCIEI